MFKRNPLFVVHISSDVGIPPIPIFEKKFIVGRKPSHLVAIPDNSISRDHLEVMLQSNQIYIMDLGTSNGTKLDGHRIPENIPTPYRQGQLIHLGNANVIIAIEQFEEDRNKRTQNPSAKAIQQLSMQIHNSQHQQQVHQTVPTQPSPAHHQLSHPITESGQSFSTTPTYSTQHTLTPHHSPVGSPIPITTPQPPAPTVEHFAPITQQNREDANRLIAKAKIEAELAAKDLLKSKESEAQKLLQQAEAKIAEKLRETELHIQQLLNNAKQEAQNLKQEKLNEVLREKEVIQKDADAIKKTIPSIVEQIEQLKLQSNKYLNEKNSIEALYSQEKLKLEGLSTEVKTKEQQLNSLLQQSDLTQAKIKEAEAKYTSTVSATQSLADETKIALSNAKEKERELHSLLESAKTEKNSALEFSKNLRADAEAYAKVTREEAELYSSQLRSDAEKWAQNLRSTTENELIHLREESTRNYQNIKESQERVLEELRNTEAIKIKNLQEIDSILKKKTDDYEEGFKARRESLESEYEKRLATLNSEFKVVKEKFESELTDRRSSIEKEMLERRELLERESVEIKQKIEKEAQELRALRDKEYKELKMQQDAYLFDIKKREEDRLKAMFEESRQAIKEQFNNKSSYVKKSMNDFFTHYEKTSAPGFREIILDLQKQITQIVHDSLTNDLSLEDKQLQQLLHFDPTIQKKHKKYWMHFTGAAVFIIGVAGYILYNPSSISTGVNSIKETVNDIDKQNKKIQAEALEQIKKASIFAPEKTKEFKKSYTDNILYTMRYLEFENDEQYRNQWIVSIKDFLIQDAKIIDDKADDIIAKEGSLIIELSNESIDGRNPDLGITRMHDKEAAFIALLTTTLSENKKKQFFEKKQSFFEQFLSDPIKSRGPANKQ